MIRHLAARQRLRRLDPPVAQMAEPAAQLHPAPAAPVLAEPSTILVKPPHAGAPLLDRLTADPQPARNLPVIQSLRVKAPRGPCLGGRKRREWGGWRKPSPQPW